MAKNDYFLLVYRILTYLYECVKNGEQPDTCNFRIITGTDFIPDGYFNYIIAQMIENGYISGIALIRVPNAKPVAKITADIEITEKGIQFLMENSMMQKARRFLKDVKETIPGL